MLAFCIQNSAFNALPPRSAVYAVDRITMQCNAMKGAVQSSSSQCVRVCVRVCDAQRYSNSNSNLYAHLEQLRLVVPDGVAALFLVLDVLLAGPLPRPVALLGAVPHLLLHRRHQAYCQAQLLCAPCSARHSRAQGISFSCSLHQARIRLLARKMNFYSCQMGEPCPDSETRMSYQP